MRNVAETAAKTALLAHLRTSGALRETKAVAVELVVGKQAHRADLVTVGPATHCYEIKSERDTLSRLEGQLAWYLQVFERVSVVAASKHVVAVLAGTDPCVGVLELTPVGLTEVRAASPSDRLVADRMLDLLPVVEVARMLRRAGVSCNGANRAALLQLSRNVPVEVVSSYLRDFLKERYRKPTQEFRLRTARRNLRASDLAYLRAWVSVEKPDPQQSPPSHSSVEWAVFSTLASAFGPVPDDIQQLLAA